MDRFDLAVGSLAWLLAQLVYFWTAAPTVTFRDSGDFITAAAHFGIPHPPGYPLWTMLAWLFTRLPLGNTAWEVNLLSGVFGALAVGLLAALMSSLSRWLGARPGTSAIVALSFGLAGAFSRPVWSQAVVAEVYTLHLLLTMGLVYVLYRWIRDPAWRSGYFASLLMLCLGLSNHHLTLVFVPLPLLVLFLVQRKAFLEYLAYSALVGSFVLVAFSQLSDQRALQTTATRALALSLGGLLLVMARKGLSNWRRGLLAFPVVAVGLSPLFIPAACRPNWTPGQLE